MRIKTFFFAAAGEIGLRRNICLSNSRLVPSKKKKQIYARKGFPRDVSGEKIVPGGNFSPDFIFLTAMLSPADRYVSYHHQVNVSSSCHL